MGSLKMNTRFAVIVLFLSSAGWGLTWMPIKALNDQLTTLCAMVFECRERRGRFRFWGEFNMAAAGEGAFVAHAYAIPQEDWV